jgi:hypothetical protein
VADEGLLLNIDWSPHVQAYWIHRVLNTLHGCKSPMLKKRVSRWDKERINGVTLGDLAVAVGIKLGMVNLIVRRVDKGLQKIALVLKSDESRVDSCLRDGTVYPLSFPQSHEVIIDFDSFLFESLSAFEITGKFVARFFNLILGQPMPEKQGILAVKKTLRQCGSPTQWIEKLSKARNHLIHGRAAWFALQVTNRKPLCFDAVFLTKTVENLEEDPDRISFEQCRSIWNGFVGSYVHLENWLKAEVIAADIKQRSLPLIK